MKDMTRRSELFQMYPILCSEEQVSIFNIVALSKIKVAKQLYVDARCGNVTQGLRQTMFDISLLIFGTYLNISP